MKKKTRSLDDSHYKNIVIPELKRQKVQKRDIKLRMPKIRYPKAAPIRSREATTTVVTVSTPFGLKSFALGKIKKRVLISFTAFTILFLIFGSFGLYVSLSNNLALEDLLSKTRENYGELVAQNKGLKNIVDEERAIKEKETNLAKMVNLKSEELGEKAIELSSIGVE